jgi:hypothetical protein
MTEVHQRCAEHGSKQSIVVDDEYLRHGTFPV